MAKYIEADALMEYLKQNWEPINDSFPMSFSLDQIKESLDEMPAADVEPVRYGEWIYSEFDYAHCSECAFEQKFQDYVTPFCPNCGAKMDGGSE